MRIRVSHQMLLRRSRSGLARTPTLDMSRSTTHGEQRIPVESPICSDGSSELRLEAAVAAPAEVVEAAHVDVATAVLR